MNPQNEQAGSGGSASAPPPPASPLPSAGGMTGSPTISARYQGAWGEVSARIQSRQLVNLHFAVAILTIGSLVVGLFNKADPQAWAPILAVVLVALTWMYSLWIRHNDAILGLLGAYMKHCELIEDPANKTGVPGWHRDDQEWIVLARRYRELSDRAGMLVAVLASIPAFFVGYWQLASNRPLGLVLIAIGIAGLSAAFFIYRNKALRNTIAQGKFSGPDWRFRM